MYRGVVYFKVFAYLRDYKTIKTKTIMYTIVNYSEKAIALTGDTKIIKDQLKNLVGRYNAHLTCGAGWIFSKSKEVVLRKFLDFPRKNLTRLNNF